MGFCCGNNNSYRLLSHYYILSISYDKSKEKKKESKGEYVILSGEKKQEQIKTGRELGSNSN